MIFFVFFIENFQGYDWLNDTKNAKHHKGSIPVYNLSTVITPVAVYWGDNDWYTAKQVRTEQGCFHFAVRIFEKF